MSPPPPPPSTHRLLVAVRLTVIALCILMGAVALVEHDARRIWQSCSSGGFAFATAGQTLTRRSWFLRVRCDEGRCRWRSVLNRWGCWLIDDHGTARPGGSG